MYFLPTKQRQAIGVTSGRYEIRFPERSADLDQDAEFCEVRRDGQWKRYRFHDYTDIYGTPGLYEALFYRRLRCCSPKRVVKMLNEVLADAPDGTREPLRVLDVGAGNGMVGEELIDAGAAEIVGVDILPAARDAAWRDRPWAYDDYRITDLTALPEDEEKTLRARRFNAMVCVAALGYGDIPARAFTGALDLIETPGWLAFNVKEDFLQPGEATGFAQLVHNLTTEGVIRVEAYRRYQHRLSAGGDPLYYVALIARKLADVPDRYLEAEFDADA